MWSFVAGEPLKNRWRKIADVPAETAESDAISKALKKARLPLRRPSTIIYAFLQATGVVDDHTVGCFRYSEVEPA